MKNNKEKLPLWYVLANRTAAVMYAEGTDREFHFMNRLSNPRGALHESELDSDRAGRSVSTSGGGLLNHALDRRHHKHEQVAKRFAGKIAQALQVENLRKRYRGLVVVAEPHFLGLLRKALPGAVREKVVREVTREYTQGSDSDLREQVFRAMGLKVAQ
jgi:protein required for attachment to host cells